MKRTPFAVTFSIVTPESAEYGDEAEYGEIACTPSLREAMRALKGTRTRHVDSAQGVEPGCMPCDRPRAVTVYNGPEFLTAAQESRTLHIPDCVTRASARRIARLAGVAARHFTQ